MFVRSSSVTMATVFLVAICAMDIVHAVMEATKETVVSLRKNCMTLTLYWKCDNLTTLSVLCSCGGALAQRVERL